jgi:hypothetical protein
MLKKPEFDCNNIGDFYDCGCAEDEKAAGGKDKSQAESQGQHQKKAHEGDAITPVEIHNEPSVVPQYFTCQLLTDHAELLGADCPFLLQMPGKSRTNSFITTLISRRTSHT